MKRNLISSRRFATLAAPSLKVRTAVAVVTLVIVTTVLVTSVSLWLAKRGMRVVVSEQQFGMVTAAADEIDQKLYDMQLALQSLASDTPRESYRDSAYLTEHLAQRAAFTSLFSSVLIVDEDGRILANSKPSEKDAAVNIIVARHARATLENGRSLISSPMLSGATQRSFVAITAPVMGGPGKTAVVFVGIVDLEQDNFLGRLTKMKIGQTGYFYVITSEGLPVTSSQKSGILKDVTYVKEGSNALRRVVAGLEGTNQVSTPAGSGDIHSFKRLHATNWIVGAVYPEEEAFAPIVRVEENSRLAVALLAILIGPLAWWIARRQLAPLQNLRNRIQTIRDDPLQAGRPVEYSKDEFGDLARAFDRLMRERSSAEANYRSTEAELRAATDSSLDAFFIFHPDRDDDGQIVDFRFWYLNANAERMIGMTHKQVQDKRLCDLMPVMRTDGHFDKYVRVVGSGDPVQEEFRIQSPHFHAQWLHSQVVPIADGVAVTMRDITERKQSEVALRDNRTFLQSLINYLPVLVFAKSVQPDADDRLVIWNKTAEKVMGYPADKVLGKCNDEIFPARLASALNEFDRKMRADPQVVTIPEFPYRRPDRTMCYLRLVSVPLFDENGQLDYVLGIVEDITERKKQDMELRLQQAELFAVNDALPLGLFRTDEEGAFTYINRTYELLSGLGLHETLGHGWTRSIHPEDRDRIRLEWACAAQTGDAYHGVHRFLHADGRVVRASIKTAAIRVDNRVTGYVGSADDVTARFEAEQAVSRSEQRLRMITDNLPALIAYVDHEERYRFCNIYYERVFNTGRKSLIGRAVRDVIGEDAYSVSVEKIATVLKGNRVSFERHFKEQNAVRHWRVDYIPDMAQNGKIPGFYVMVLDITELKLVESQLRTIARLDSLTGIANRHCFDEKLSEAIARSQRGQQAMALMFLDIDHFKEINDSVGHHGGDQVLRQFSQRLLSSVRQTDTVARLAGDEFVIILEGLQTPDEASAIAAKIIANMEPVFELPTGSRKVTTSVGITIRRADEIDADTILRRADEALYSAKSAGRNTFKIIY